MPGDPQEDRSRLSRQTSNARSSSGGTRGRERRFRPIDAFPIDVDAEDGIPVGGKSGEDPITIYEAFEPRESEVVMVSRKIIPRNIIKMETQVKLKKEVPMDKVADPMTKSSREAPADLEVIEIMDSGSPSNPEPPSKTQGRRRYRAASQANSRSFQRATQDLKKQVAKLEQEIKKIRDSDKRIKEEVKDLKNQFREQSKGTPIAANRKRTETSDPEDPQARPSTRPSKRQRVRDNPRASRPSGQQEGNSTRQAKSPTPATDQPPSGLSQGGDNLTTLQTRSPTTGQPSSTSASDQQEGNNATRQTRSPTTGQPSSTSASDQQEGNNATRQTRSPTTGQPSSTLASDQQEGNNITLQTRSPTTGQPSSTSASDQQEGNNATRQTESPTPAAAPRPPHRRGGFPISALMHGDPPLPPKHIGDVPDASGSVPHPAESSKQSRGSLSAVTESRPSTDCPTSIPQQTATPSAGAANTAVKSFNLSENVVHELAQAALLRLKNDHAYPREIFGAPGTFSR